MISLRPNFDEGDCSPKWAFWGTALIPFVPHLHYVLFQTADSWRPCQRHRAAAQPPSAGSACCSARGPCWRCQTPSCCWSMLPRPPHQCPHLEHNCNRDQRCVDDFKVWHAVMASLPWLHQCHGQSTMTSSMSWPVYHDFINVMASLPWLHQCHGQSTMTSSMSWPVYHDFINVMASLPWLHQCPHSEPNCNRDFFKFDMLSQPVYLGLINVHTQNITH